MMFTIKNMEYLKVHDDLYRIGRIFRLYGKLHLWRKMQNYGEIMRRLVGAIKLEWKKDTSKVSLKR